MIDSEERNHVIAQENAKLVSDLEKTQTTLNEIAQEHSHLLYTQARKQNRKYDNFSNLLSDVRILVHLTNNLTYNCAFTSSSLKCFRGKDNFFQAD